MASWKNNKVVGIIMGLVAVITFILIIRSIIAMRPVKAPSLEEQIQKMGGRI